MNSDQVEYGEDVSTQNWKKALVLFAGLYLKKVILMAPPNQA